MKYEIHFGKAYPLYLGYDKDYHYDYNFSDFGPPPMYPTSSSLAGGAILIIKSYGEVDQLTLKEYSE